VLLRSERIAGIEVLEPPESTVARVDRGRAVLAHQRDQVQVAGVVAVGPGREGEATANIWGLSDELPKLVR